MTTSVMFSPKLHQIMVGNPDAAFERVCTALKAADFDIVAEINLADFLAKKLDSYINPYKILVVCNAAITQRAITIAPDAGIVLPFHVAVSQPHENQIQIKIIDPHITWNTASNTYLEPLAEELKVRFEKVIAALG